MFLPTRPYTPRHKGKVENGIDYVQDNALKGRRFASLAGAEPLPARLGADRGRHPDPRHHAPPGRQALRRRRAGGAGAAAAGAVPVVSRSVAARAPRRPRRGRAGLLRGAAGVPGAGGLGAVGRPPGADLQRADGADRRAHQAGAGPLQHPTQVHRLRRRSAGSSVAPRGSWAG